MSAEESIEAAADQHKPKTLFRSQYRDVMVKIDDDIYYLDRLQLALKSEYFEKLFTEDYSDKNSDLIEIPLMDTDTFCTIVGIIYGEKLESVINVDNFVSLLMAMDYLQMDIDLWTYTNFVTKQLGYDKPLNKDAFRLYHFIADDAKYKDLLRVVYQHLSDHLRELQDSDELLSIKSDHFFQIISRREQLPESATETRPRRYPFRMISTICARWICQNMESRLKHALNLVNAARFRFCFSAASHEDFKVPVSSSTDDEHVKRTSMSRYFYKWLMYCAEISYSKPEHVPVLTRKEQFEKLQKDISKYIPRKTGKNTHSIMFSREPKLEAFLKNSNFYDITVKAGEKVYKLHRSVLKSESSYFEEIFSSEYSELAAQCKEIPPALPSKDKIYSLDEIDSATFDVIVDHMYLGKVEPTCDIIVRLFKAVHVLKIDNLKNPSSEWMMTNSENICAKDIVEILNFTHASPEYEKLNRFFLSKYIVDSWPKIDNLPQFADVFKAIALPDEGGDSNERDGYQFDKLDPDTFRVIIEYIYFDKVGLRSDNVASVFKASSMFKMDKLIEACENWLIENRASMSLADVREVVSLTLGNVIRYEDINTLYLVDYAMRWPQVDMELFCSIPYDCLENMLMSCNLYFDDPLVLLDICSKWVVHDLQERYCLIPQIAFAISRNFSADCDNYPTNFSSSLDQCSQDSVKDKIWKILSSTSVLPSAVSSSDKDDTKIWKTGQPVFITSDERKAFRVFNADWDEIVSFELCEHAPYDHEDSSYTMKYPMSATIVNDNLFILCLVEGVCFFYGYNFSSQKLFNFPSDPRILGYVQIGFNVIPKDITLLNRCDEIYCCREDGRVLKYSLELNRWMQFSIDQPIKFGIRFASDGSTLYRMHEAARTDSMTIYSVHVYDFSQNQWVSAPDWPDLTRYHESYSNSEEHREIRELVFVHNYGLTALFYDRCVFVFDRETRVWRETRRSPYNSEDVIRGREIINQNEAGDTLYVHINKLYQMSPTDQSWVLKKEWPLIPHPVFARRYFAPYGNIIGIHNPKIIA